jgi:hypothetical protein
MTIDIDINPIQSVVINFSKTLSRTPVVKTTSNVSGNEILKDGTAGNISGAFFRKEDEWAQDKAGLFQEADAILLVLPSVTINKNDKITYETEVYRVDKQVMRKIKELDCYKVAQLFKI